MKQKELMQTEFNLFKMNLSEQANTMSFKDFFEKIRKNPPEVASSGFKIWCPRLTKRCPIFSAQKVVDLRGYVTGYVKTFL